MVTTQLKDNRNKKRMRQLQTATAGVILGTSLMSTGGIVKAEPISKAPNAEVPSKDSEISNKYSFIAKWITGKSKLELSKTASLKTTPTGNAIWVEPKKDEKGKLTAYYTNVGTYHGKQIDYKATVVDWKEAGFEGGQYMRFAGSKVNGIGFTQAGYEWIDIHWEPIYHDTGKPATDITGTYMGINDIDAKQYAGFPDKQMSKISKVYHSKDSWIDYEHKDGFHRFQELDGELSDPKDAFAKFTILSDSHDLSMRWGKDWTDYNKDKVIKWDEGQYAQYFGYDGEKPAKTETLEPFKLVSDQDEKDVEKNKLDTLYEGYHYDITHTVPAEEEQFYYKDYGFKDDINSELEVKKVTITNSEGKDVTTEYFDNKSEGNKLHYQAKSSILKKKEFYENDYKFKVDVKLKKDADLSKITNDKGEIQILNKAKVYKDGKDKDTNEVVTTPPKPIKPSVTKKIIDQNGNKVDMNDVKIGDTFKYEKIAQFGNKEADVKRGVIDEVTKPLKINDIKVMDEKDQEITKDGDLKIDEKTNTYSWFAKGPKKLAGKKIKVLADVTVRDDVSLKEYEKDGQFVLPNTIKIVEGDKETPSNEVETVLEKVDFKTEKVIVDDTGKEVKENEVKAGESYTYRIKTDIPNAEKVDAIKIEDDMNDVLQIDGMKVYLGGKKITSEKNQEESSNTEDNDNQSSKNEENKNDASSNNEDVGKNEESLNTEETVKTEKNVNNETTDQDEGSTNTEENESNKDVTDLDSSTNTENVNEDGSNTDKREDVTKEGKSTIDEEKSSVKWENEKPDTKYRGGHLETDIDVTIPKDVDLSKLKQEDGKSIIDNVAISTVNEEKKETNQVTTKVPKEEKEVTPVPEKPEEPKDPQEPTPENPEPEAPQEQPEKVAPPTEQPQSAPQQVKETPQEKPNMIQSVLPKTGTETMTWLIVMGGVLIAGGLTLLKLRKKNSEG
ncbi:isopeptide-forming domain-containing fimbrial protein [Mammaliicoccus sciuri]|uniref:Isopeptide-forming domain-containing fimbrial protein n=1 Tax=Mammaliicoccus sciuri TaxID=1296 RepID=A0AAI8DL47_MAMSC|nr:isopeptide-forming domain-containing fimbrial protein [Mammaliicoccus sciuri]ASE35738.1 isopeptide-forming domain-containing fimbrial protein [Mammaliicoccus sciuri]